jgi:hypothetical protein
MAAKMAALQLLCALVIFPARSCVCRSESGVHIASVNVVKTIVGVVAAGVLVFGSSTMNAESKETGATKNRRTLHKPSSKTCFVRFGGSAFPEPCDRLGEMPATAEPMHIIGKLPTTRDAR